MWWSSCRGSPSPLTSCQHTRLLLLTSYSTPCPLPVQTGIQQQRCPLGLLPSPCLVQQDTVWKRREGKPKGMKRQLDKARKCPFDPAGCWPSPRSTVELFPAWWGGLWHLRWLWASPCLHGTFRQGPQGSGMVTSPCLALCLCFKLFPAVWVWGSWSHVVETSPLPLESNAVTDERCPRAGPAVQSGCGQPGSARHIVCPPFRYLTPSSSWLFQSCW